MTNESPFAFVANMRTLSPAFKDLIDERFSKEASSAQNLTILLSGLGIAVSFGIITIDEVHLEQGFHFEIASATAAVWVLLVTYSNISVLRVLNR